MEERDITEADVVNVLRSGRIPDPPESDVTGAKLTYRVCTERMTVVVALRSECSIRIVSAFRKVMRGRV